MGRPRWSLLSLGDVMAYFGPFHFQFAFDFPTVDFIQLRIHHTLQLLKVAAAFSECTTMTGLRRSIAWFTWPIRRNLATAQALCWHTTIEGICVVAITEGTASRKGRRFLVLRLANLSLAH